MAITVKLDAVREAIFESDDEGDTYVRAGFAYDTDRATDAPLALERLAGATGMPAIGDALSASRTDMTLRRQIFRTSDTIAGKSILSLIYSNKRDSGVQTVGSYMLRTRGFLAERETCFLPGTRATIETGYSATIGGVTYSMESRTAKVRVLSPMKEIQVVSLVSSELSNVDESIGCVNSTTTFGKGKGFWLVTSAEETAQSKTGGPYGYSVTILSRVVEDWGEFHVMMDPNTGEPVKFADGDRATLADQPYSYGVHNLGGTKGLIRIDAYKEIDYSLIGVP